MYLITVELQAFWIFGTVLGNMALPDKFIKEAAVKHVYMRYCWNVCASLFR